MNTIIKKIFGLIILFLGCLAFSCTEPAWPNPKQCYWDTNGKISFSYPLELKVPKDMLTEPQYTNRYFSSSMTSLTSLFNQANAIFIPKINVSTTQNGCDLDQTKTTTISSTGGIPSNVSADALSNIDRALAGSIPTTTVEITTGDFYLKSMDKGHVIWSKKLVDDPYSTWQNGVFEGKFVVTVAKKSIVEPVYVDGKFVKVLI